MASAYLKSLAAKLGITGYYCSIDWRYAVPQLLEVAAIAGEQWGLVTAAQAARVGVSAQSMARWARDDVLARVAHGVYKVVGSPYDPRDDLRAAWLMLDPKRTATERISDQPIDAVISHRSAAQLHNLGDLDADVYEFTVEGRRQTRRRDVRIHTRLAAIPRESWGLISGLPVTTVMTTIADLAASHIDGGHLGGIVRDAIAKTVVDVDSLSDALRPYAHRYGAALGDGEGAVRRFLTDAGLPRATHQAAELVRDKGLSEVIGDMALSDPELMRRAIENVTKSNPELMRRAIENMTKSNPEMMRRAIENMTKANPEMMRRAIEKISRPSPQRTPSQAAAAEDAARKAAQ